MGYLRSIIWLFLCCATAFSQPLTVSELGFPNGDTLSARDSYYFVQGNVSTTNLFIGKSSRGKALTFSVTKSPASGFITNLNSSTGTNVYVSTNVGSSLLTDSAGFLVSGNGKSARATNYFTISQASFTPCSTTGFILFSINAVATSFIFISPLPPEVDTNFCWTYNLVVTNNSGGTANTNISVLYTNCGGVWLPTPPSGPISPITIQDPATCGGYFYLCTNVCACCQTPVVAVNDSYTTTYTNSLVVAAPGILGNDSGGCGALSVTGHTSPTNGSLTIGGDGSFTYVPNVGITTNVSDSFQYVASDGTSSSSATVSISVFHGYGPLIPQMTSSNTPSGFASASTNTDTAYLSFTNSAWQTPPVSASDGTNSPGTNVWIQYQFNTPKTIAQIYGIIDQAKPFHFRTLQGSTNGFNWVTIFTNSTPTSNYFPTPVSIPTNYTGVYFRWNFKYTPGSESLPTTVFNPAALQLYGY